jgi:hypothetical protein
LNGCLLTFPWPPKGKELTLEFKLGQRDIETQAKKAKTSGQTDLEYLKDITIKVHYNLYDHLPLMCKWITVENNSNRTITVDSFKSEVLAVTDPESAVDQPDVWRKSKLYIETDYAFGDGMSPASCLEKSVFWNKDPLYETQVNYLREAPTSWNATQNMALPRKLFRVNLLKASGPGSWPIKNMTRRDKDWSEERCTGSLPRGSRKIPY